jgi:LAO/AO transport system kinase
MWDQLLQQIALSEPKALARSISLVENEVEGYEQFLGKLPVGHAAVTGITGPPGAGKSTLVDALIHQWVLADKKVGVLCIDPSSPFNLGAVLGDRIRMSDWYNHPNVFIRSLATRGSLGGLHPHIIEIVGVGQSEIEIAGLADTTVVVVVPEAGDEVQTMKAGLMEIADIFVVNKSDRPEADTFVRNLRMMLAPAFHQTTTAIPVIKTIATDKTGLAELATAIEQHQQEVHHSERKDWLLTERAWKLIQQHRMKDINKQVLKDKIASLRSEGTFNLFSFIHSYTQQ